MKKYTLIIAVFTSLVLTACGSGSATNDVMDSTNIMVDTTSSVDSTSVETPVGGGGSGSGGEGREYLPTKSTEHVK